MGVLEEEERVKVAERIFKEMMIEKFPNQMKKINQHIKDAQ